MILAPYVHEKASLDLKAAIHQLENEDDPLKRYPLLDDVEKAYKAIVNAQRTLGQDMPPFECAPKQEEVDKYEMEFLIDNWMPADCLTILTGPGGIGKSYLSLQYVAALAMGYNANTYALMPDDNEKPDGEKQDPIDIVIASYEETRIRGMEADKTNLRGTSNGLTMRNYQKQIHYVDLQGMGPAWGVATGDHLASPKQDVTPRRIPAFKEQRSWSAAIGIRSIGCRLWGQ